MKQFIEITRTSGPVCVELPNRNIINGYNPANLTLKVHREGVRSLLAIYPAQLAEGSKMCFLIDDDLVNAHPGWYIGTIYNCKKPVHSLRMSVPRPKFGLSSAQRMKTDCSKTNVELCSPDTCGVDVLAQDDQFYVVQ